MSADQAVIGTNDDASSCKRFAVDKGYWVDPYISLFMQKSSSRKAPEINRGYYARVTSIQIIIEKFIKVVCFQSNEIIKYSGIWMDFHRKKGNVLPSRVKLRFGICRD